jgi:hypothetical protein
MSQLLRRAGARRVDVVAATDTRPRRPATTLRRLLTADGGRLRFGRAGVGDDELARAGAVAAHRQFAAVPAGRGTRHACPGCRGPPGRQGISSLGHGGQSARRFGSAVPTATLIAPCSVWRSPSSSAYLSPSQRSSAVRAYGVGTRLRLRPDLLQSIRAQRGGCTTVATIASQSVNLNLNSAEPSTRQAHVPRPPPSG